jgi:2-amino-4-hydroxy-6-hydroxymethyldihydropteridine diphosphokinase
MRRVVLALGSNIEVEGQSRFQSIELAISKLSEKIINIQRSSLIETEPVGGPTQGSYINAVIIGECELSARELLEFSMAIEAKMGRVRKELNGPRIIDIDLITYGDEVISEVDLIIPHPRAHLRHFVLAPWLEIDREASLPGLGSVAELLRKINSN